MTGLEIPVGPASVFTMILIGYFVLTVWFGKPEPIVQKVSQPQPQQPSKADDRPRDLNVAG